MGMTNIPMDVPSPVDLRVMDDARQWEQSAMVKRPWRTDIFERIVMEARIMPRLVRQVLELGSGPGFLADRLLAALPQMNMTLLDYSAAMHQLARARLGSLAKRAVFVEKDFKKPDWMQGLGKFDCIVTNQAVHELRHKRHAAALHAQVRSLLQPHGAYLMCDHFHGEGGMENDQLFMSVAEHREALLSAGFVRVDELMQRKGAVLFRAALA
jgi:SAM-dependent methyltransferase